jgi:hypothetical protein
MTQANYAKAELERQELIKQAHSLIAAIASRPGSTKLLRTIVPILKLYATYKKSRASAAS